MDVLKDRGICVVTHGDNFEADTEEENVDFIDWCQEQIGDIKTLFDECNFHCVLFNNKTKSQDTKNDQLTRLLQYVPRAKPYTEKDFISAFKDLNKMRLEYEVPKIIEETNAFIKSKRQKLQEIDSETDESQKRVQLEQIKDDIAQYNHNLLETTGDEEMIKQPLQSLKIFSLEVNAKLKMCQEKRKIIGIEDIDIDASQSQTEEKRPLQLVSKDHFSKFSSTAIADLQDALMTDSEDYEYVSIKPPNHSCVYLQGNLSDTNLLENLVQELFKFECKVKDLKIKENVNSEDWEQFSSDFAKFEVKVASINFTAMDPEKKEQFDNNKRYISTLIEENTNQVSLGKIWSFFKTFWENIYRNIFFKLQLLLPFKILLNLFIFRCICFSFLRTYLAV
uniref:AIG1-type G domain-containing protein n=1 Tax=Biomphalaria glabrata TaxID=6526 RepID=A0A2C9KU57_BIOGL